MEQGLLSIDIQNDYFPGGAMELVGMTGAAAQAAKLLAKFRQEGRPVYFIQHLANRPQATFFLPATKGAEIHESVVPGPGRTGDHKAFSQQFSGDRTHGSFAPGRN